MWSVVEACSGVRYVIASVKLGVLYAYLTYRSIWRRALFVLVSAIVPVLANTVRAYIIVMLGHLSDMKLATGVDHLIYGWVFFGLVIFALFWLGSFWREDGPAAPVDNLNQLTGQGAAGSGFSKLLASTLTVLLAAAVWPLWAHTTQSRSDTDLCCAVTLPAASGGWRAALEPNWHWQPDSAVAGQVASYYDLDGQTLGLFIQYADGDTQEGEVVGSSTRFVVQDGGMRVIAADKVTLRLGDVIVPVDQAHLLGVGGQLLAWSWYRIGDLDTSNDYLAKFREAWATLGFGASGSYRVVVVLPQQAPAASTRVLLQGFLDTHGDKLNEELSRAMGGEQRWTDTSPR